MTTRPAEKPWLHAGRISGVPAILSHSDHDTPVPTWKQVTRSVNSTDSQMISHLSRVLSGTDNESLAVRIWDSWSGPQKRSVALLVDKIYHEGWLDLVGSLVDGPWDGGFFFLPRDLDPHALADVLEAKFREDGVYLPCSLRGGLAGYLSGWNHPGWQKGWIETDTPFASLHVGIFENGSAEVHLDLFNPLHTNGASLANIVTVRGLGSYNHRLFRLHRKWEGKQYGAITRTSANFYHLMRGHVPLCF
ncbi:MAG TPA: hypothetical protein VKN18_02560 [Blastocatellia bacterium]|nr:hypothetical protein [Blastocatellia bacterium]